MGISFWFFFFMDFYATYIYIYIYHYHQPLSVHCKRRPLLDVSSQPCFLSVVLFHSTPINLTISCLQWHCGFFFDLFVFLGIQCRTLVAHLPSFLIPRGPAQFNFNFFALEMPSVILVWSLIHLSHLLSLLVNPIMHISMLFLFVSSFLNVLLVNV